MVDFLLILIHLLLAEEHAREGEQAGGAVAQHKLRRDVEPAGQPRVVHARVQRTRRHAEIWIGCQIGAVLSSSGVQAARCGYNKNIGSLFTMITRALAVHMSERCDSTVPSTFAYGMSTTRGDGKQCSCFCRVLNLLGTVHFFSVCSFFLFFTCHKRETCEQHYANNKAKLFHG